MKELFPAGVFFLAAVLSARAGEEIVYTNSRNIRLPCSIVCGPSGVKSVEIWVTEDGGKTWRKKAVRTLEEGTLSCWLKKDGRYGFRTVVTARNNRREPEPGSGEAPELEFVVDTVPPAIEFSCDKDAPVLAPGESTVLRWRISDAHLAPESCRMRFSIDGGRTWRAESKVSPAGRKVFTASAAVKTAVFQVAAADRAGNTAVRVIAFSIRSRPEEGKGVPPKGKETGEEEKPGSSSSGKGRKITVIVDGQPREYYLPSDEPPAEEIVSPVPSGEETEIVIIDEKAGKGTKSSSPRPRGPGEGKAVPAEEKKPKAASPRPPAPRVPVDALDGKAVQYCRKAVDYEVFDDFARARTYYLAALKREPKYYRARRGLADLYFRHGYYRYALKHFKKLLLMDPENTDIMVYYGFCLYKAGSGKEAEKELKKVLAADPDNVDCLWYLSKIYKESKRIDEAVELWVRIKNLGPARNKWYDFADNYLTIYASFPGCG